VAENSTRLGIDPSRLSVGGGSAGGNLAAAVALMARDRGGPPLVLQVLEIPCLAADGEFPSLVENDGYVLSRALIGQMWADYLADPADAANPYACPLAAEDLSGLPPAVVMTAECDPLRDEGEAYAARLAQAGVPVVSRRWEGQIHGASAMTALLPSARECRAQIHQALRDAFKVEAPSAR
jgi:acetyl esterase